MLKKSIHSSKLVLLVIVFLVLGSLWLGKVYFTHSKPKPLKLLPVKVEQALSVKLPIHLQVTGQLIAARQVDLTPEISGHVARVFFKDGGISVHKGQQIIQLNDEEAKARFASAKAAFVYAKADFQRKVKLSKRGAVSVAILDQSLAALNSKKAAVTSAQVALNYTRILAPFDGVLGKVNVTAGDYVSAGNKLVSLIDLSTVRAEYSLPESYYSQLKIGQSVIIQTSAWHGKKFIGKVSFISPIINTADRRISLLADFLNPQRELTAGQFVEIEHILGQEKKALVITPAALVSTIDGQAVFKVTLGKVIRIPVFIISRNKNQVQIKGDLTAGDSVVVAGQLKLRDGMQVEVVQ